MDHKQPPESPVTAAELHQTFMEHLREFKLHEEEDARRWEQQRSLLAEITKNTEQNAKAIENLVKATEGVVELHRDMVGAVRTGSRVNAAVAWLLKWGALGTACAAGIDYFLNKTGGG